MVRVEQNGRGGIENTTTVRYDSTNEKHAKVLADYVPKKDFRGGWAVVPVKAVNGNGRKRKSA